MAFLIEVATCRLSVSITDSDSHSFIIDEKVGNNASPLIIEDHVWIGKNAVILKGGVQSDGILL